MKKITVIILFLILLATSISAFEYEMKIDDSLTYAQKTVTILNIGTNGIIFDVSGNQTTIFLNKPKNFDNLYIIPRSIFYVKEQEARTTIVDFCEKKEEICNNIDDDCDGFIDDGVTKECGEATGICSKGKQTCSGGEWGYCIGAMYPQGEICNGRDDDCDGVVDENLSRQCGNSPTIGACQNGFQECVDGNWTECDGQVYPKPEVCNQKDDDCDGKADEELVKFCGVSSVGECSQTKISCQKGEWEDCKAEMPTQEICDGKDNDCDGEVDEELTKTCGDSGVGECSYGIESCIEGDWSDCEGGVLPDTEWCDNLDNDCDGLVDNDCKTKGFISKLFGFFRNIFS